MSRDDDDLPMSRIPPVDEDVRREVAFHIEARAAELEARGMTPDDARATAREFFGDKAAVEAECREIESRRRATNRRARRWDALRQDVRLGARLLRRSPGYTAAAVLTLALGIGANTAVFSIVNRVLLQPLAFENADRLVTMTERHESGWANLAYATYLDLREQSRSFDALAEYGAGTSTVIGTDRGFTVNTAWISRDFFKAFPLRPVMGRLPLPDEHVEGAVPVVVVSFAFWRDVLGAPSSLDTVRLRGSQDFAVVGVLPAEFDFPGGTQVWQPMELIEQSESHTSHRWDTIGRLALGVSPAAAQRDVDQVLARLNEQYYPDFDAVGSTITPLQDAMTATSRTPLYLLLAASAILLLTACTNLASASLARGTARQTELSVRSALGATRGRLVRQLVTEAVLVSVLGCLAGLGMAAVMLRLLATQAPPTLQVTDVPIDGWVLAFAAIVSVVTALLFGLLPALRLSESGTRAVLRGGTRGTGEGGRLRIWNMLVAAEVALAVVLLSGSALLIRSFSLVLETDLGFDPDQVTAATVDLPSSTYDRNSTAIPTFHARVLEQLRMQPGVGAAGFINVAPLGGNNPNGRMEVEGKPHDPRGPFTGSSVYRVIGGDYFSVMGIPLRRGRVFGPADDAAAAPVVVVSEAFVKEEWPGEDPIGKRVRPNGMDVSDEPWHVVIGVVGDVRGASVTDEFRETYYFDHRQRPAARTGYSTYVVRSSLAIGSVSALLRQGVASIDPLVVVESTPFRAFVAESVADRRFTMLVLGTFALVALVLAVVGIYAVVSYSVAQRTREMGVRLALGATPSGLRGLVVRGSMAAVIPGLLAGLVLSIGLSGALRSLLYGVTRFDPLSLGTAVALLGGAALVSVLIPAMRATRVDPMLAIRAE
ncbi:MAG: ABC transporter permease [Gemmatimonadetes bacterium]|nr:ABC transporter permease [Gemmatimonadota bacterium]